MDRPIHLDASMSQRGNSFAHAMRNALRRDPTIIMIGEASDLETILAAKAAADATSTRSTKGD